jgi:8-oxo-dGTP diphosphatase
MNTYQKIVATGLLLHEGKALIVQRHLGEAFLPGEYELPGGKVDFGEHPRHALIREYGEETQLDVEVVESIREFSYISDNGQRHTVEIVFLVTLADPRQKAVLSKDHINYQWVTLDEADHYLDGRDEVMASLKLAFQRS